MKASGLNCGSVTGTINKLLKHVLAFWVLLSLASTAAGAQPAENKHFSRKAVTFPNGLRLEEAIINGPPVPPPGFDLERQAVSLPDSIQSAGVKVLSTPAYDWVFGCSAVSGAMIAGYYDRTGMPNIYTGPTDGGVMPMDNSAWSVWSDGTSTYPNCPLVASKLGVDGRSTPGSIDDYWIQYDSTLADPYLTYGWREHGWGDAIGDYMKTSQSSYGNVDGATSFWTYYSSQRLTCDEMASLGINADGTQGRRLFYQARGYPVGECYNQRTDNMVAGGFSYAHFKTEIDAGRPVMLNLAGHTIVGVGYDETLNLVYLHDTWDHLTHTMTWGAGYAGMDLYSVSVVNLYTDTSYTVSFNSNGGSPVPDQNVRYGGNATRPPDPTRTGSYFVSWYLDAGFTTEYDFSTPVTANITLHARWADSLASVTVTTAPSGRSVIVDGVAYATPKTFSWVPGTVHTLATTSLQTEGGSRYIFGTWSDAGAQTHDIKVPFGGATFTAIFITQHQLTTSVYPSSKGSISPTSGGWYHEGDILSLEVLPAKNYVFSSWTGPVADAGANPTTIVMTGPASVTGNVAGAAVLTASIASKTGGSSARTWAIKLANNGKGPATQARLTGFSLNQTAGTACSPVITSTFPVPLGDILSGSSASGTISLNFSGCSGAAKFKATVSYVANGGVSGTEVFRNQSP